MVILLQTFTAISSAILLNFFYNSIVFHCFNISKNCFGSFFDFALVNLFIYSCCNFFVNVLDNFSGKPFGNFFQIFFEHFLFIYLYFFNFYYRVSILRTLQRNYILFWPFIWKFLRQ